MRVQRGRELTVRAENERQRDLSFLFLECLPNNFFCRCVNGLLGWA